jgi:peptide/nickel transport system permease protein
MNSAFVRTAILKGLSHRQVVMRHVLRNAMMAPITVIMLHVNWLIGGLVVVESVFGYPGLGNLILNAALYKDVYSIEAGAMLLILLAVGTQLIADIIYSIINPRIRYT